MSPIYEPFISLVVSAIAWSLVYYRTSLQAIQLALLMIFRDYLLVGVVLATFFWSVLDFAPKDISKVLSKVLL